MSTTNTTKQAGDRTKIESDYEMANALKAIFAYEIRKGRISPTTTIRHAVNNMLVSFGEPGAPMPFGSFEVIDFINGKI